MMTDENWSWLQLLPFGALIFGFPRDGMKPIPEMIAGGDLDGDRYFVCWEKEILTNIQAEPMIETPCIVPEKNETNSGIPQPLMSIDNNTESSQNKDWFQLAQEQMANSSAHDIGQLIGKLYNASVKAANLDLENFIRNKDAEAFADAYYQALEHGKHGTKIILPLHLHQTLPKRFHPHLSAP